MWRSTPFLVGVTAFFFASACGGGSGDPDGGQTCDLSLAFEHGGDGVADPLGAPVGQARAGRATAAMLPPVPGGLVTWQPGDVILANDKVALVIEDAGFSDLYDPWGGKPVGLGRVAGGALVEPGDFGELLLLVGRNGFLVDRVSVLHDGSDGQAAVVRASGRLAPLPFFENITGNIFRETYPELTAAIDYVLAPGAEHVDIVLHLRSPRTVDLDADVVMHGFMYTPRAPIYAPGLGFPSDDPGMPYAAFVDDEATSWAYSVPGQELGAGISASGFVSKFTDGYTIARCAETTVTHARLTIGGPGLDGLLQAVARADGATLRAISGTVTDGAGEPAAGVSVHATREDGGYLTRARTDAAGAYTVHVPAGAAVQLTAFRRGEGQVGPATVAADGATQDFQLPASGLVHVTAKDADSGAALPVRVQIRPTSGSPPELPDAWGEARPQSGRVHVDFAEDGDTTLRVAAGTWRVVVSRGYEYELVDAEVSVAAGQTVTLNATLARVVDTTGVQCADFHIHTHRSNDSEDDAALKLRALVADGLEIPVRSEHEFVDDFQPMIEQMGLEAWAHGIGSVEMTSMEIWGHMGVVPLEPDPTKPNNGTPLWQEFPTHLDAGVPLRTMRPSEVFDAVRARPEQPIVIINHPRGSTNYFGYVGYDPVTGGVTSPQDWDEEFTVVEFFNDSGWLANRAGLVMDWLGFLNHGRRVFAVGSSDSHGVRSSPVGYPRTCLRLGTDDPREVTPSAVRDATGAGRSTISGGVYVDASVGKVGPGEEASGLGDQALVHVRVQAASWVDVDAIDIVVDGETIDTIAILPGDADPQNPAVRFEKDVAVPVAAGGSYVIVAAYGDSSLEPVHPGRMPFGVTNPIFLLP
jgi:hypothetical protein